MLLYAKHPTDKRWIVFSSDESGKLTRICSYKSSPARLGYKKIPYPSNYEGKPLTEMIKIVN